MSRTNTLGSNFSKERTHKRKHRKKELEAGEVATAKIKDILEILATTFSRRSCRWTASKCAHNFSEGVHVL